MTGKINVNGNNSESWGKCSYTTCRLWGNTHRNLAGESKYLQDGLKRFIHSYVRHQAYCSRVICKMVLDCNWVSPYQLPLHRKDFIEIHVKASIKLMGPCEIL